MRRALPLLFLVSTLWLALACGGRTLGADADGGAAPSSEFAPSGVGGADWNGSLLPSTPGAVRCGGGTCPALTEECCLRYDAVPASNGCGSRSGSICNGTQDVRRCDETADCGPGEICCLSEISGLPAIMVSFCQSAAEGAAAKCAKFGGVGCGSDADCDAFGLPACFAQRCRGDVLQTCGPLASQLCDP